MSQGGPRPSAFYMERQLLTRLPATPATPGQGVPVRNSNTAAGQSDPGPGNPTPGDGLLLAGLFAVTVSVYATPGQTLTSGYLLCWVWNTYQQAWTRCTDLDFTIAPGVDGTAFNAQTFAPNKNTSRLGLQVNWLANQVVTSGGTDVLVRLDAFTSVLGMSA